MSSLFIFWKKVKNILAPSTPGRYYFHGRFLGNRLLKGREKRRHKEGRGHNWSSKFHQKSEKKLALGPRVNILVKFIPFKQNKKFKRNKTSSNLLFFVVEKLKRSGVHDSRATVIVFSLSKIWWTRSGKRAPWSRGWMHLYYWYETNLITLCFFQPIRRKLAVQIFT